ncbi:hypothetical protein FRC11_012408 [Ceratobasidium sp. 423]|nr:hypothetical protein FRC11_012408 [Ceratobasidium sp. 423]
MDANPNSTADPAPDAPSRSGGEPDPARDQAPIEQPTASEPSLPADAPHSDVNQAGPSDSSKDEAPAAHITRSPTPPEAPDAVMDPVPAPQAPERAPSSEASAEAPHSPDPSVPVPAATPPPAASAPAPTQAPAQETPQQAPAQAPAVSPEHTAHLPLTRVQTAEVGQMLTARQLGQRARRARERELQAQGLYTPKRRTSSSATMPDLQSHAPAQPRSADVTMQGADEGDDDGEGELESEVAGGPTTTPSVPPHSAAHLIPPIAVLAPVTTPSRASIAQRARRDRERATRLGLSPEGSPNETTDAQPPVSTQPIPFNPTGTSGQQPPPTLTRGQLAQRARRARERVERAAKAAGQNGHPPGENWTPSLNSNTDGSGGMSSAGEAVFAVAPPPPGYSPGQIEQTSPQAGYGVGLGAAHVPQQLNRAQLAQRARRARERQQRLSAASTHASGLPPTSPLGKEHPRSDSGSAPPTSPSAGRRQSDASPTRTSLSPVTSTTGDAPAPLNINMQVFQSLTAGDNGVSRAIADSGAGVLTSGARTTSPSERVTSPSAPTPAPAPAPKNDAPKVEEAMEVDPTEENVDQLSEEPAPTPSPNLHPPTPPIQTASPNPQPEVHMSAIQSVGA